VRGESTSWHAAVGLNSGTQGSGVYGHSAGAGVIGESETWMGCTAKATALPVGRASWARPSARAFSALH